MDARFYNTEDLDIEQLANNLQNVYQSQGYHVQQVGNRDQVLVQLKKGGDFEALIGLQAALSVIIQRSAGGVVAMIGQQKWVDKAAVGAVGLVAAPILWPLMITAGAGAIRQASLSNQVLNIVDSLVRQQRPGIIAGPIPIHIMPQIQQQWAPPSYAPPPPQYIPPPQNMVVQALPAPQVIQPTPVPTPVASQLRCSVCNSPYDENDTFCPGCGRSLRTLCANCGAEIKPGVAFCPRCGKSTFQSATQAAPPALAPMPAPPAYTPPTQVTPAAPTYTPPPAPAAPRYTPPPQPQPYIPPVPQQPPVVPQPSITFIPATPKQDTPSAPQQPSQPQYPPTPVYKPPLQQPPMPSTARTPQPPKPIVAKPVSQPAVASTAVWGNLTFSDGTQFKLSGERAVIGRYDHDLGGLIPEVDLNKMPGSEAVSRIHAAIEHIGSTYTLIDLNSTNRTRLNGKTLEPDKATPLNDGDSLQFAKLVCTFKKA